MVHVLGKGGGAYFQKLPTCQRFNLPFLSTIFERMRDLRSLNREFSVSRLIFQVRGKFDTKRVKEPFNYLQLSLSSRSFRRTGKKSGNLRRILLSFVHKFYIFYLYFALREGCKKYPFSRRCSLRPPRPFFTAFPYIIVIL